MHPSPHPMQEDYDNNTPSPRRPASPRKAQRSRTRRKELNGIPVEVTQTKDSNPANPYNYLRPTERAERLAQLWHNLFQHLESENSDPSDDQSS